MVKFRHSSRQEPRRRYWPRRVLFVIGVLLLLLVAATVIVRQIYDENLKPVSSSTDTTSIVVRSGASVDDISKQLYKAGLIRTTWAFQWYVRSKELRAQLQAGTYSFSPSQSVQEIVNTMASGKVATNLITILPGQRLDQLKAAFVKAQFDAAAVDAAFNPAQYANNPALADKPASASLEGFLYPDTFQKDATTNPSVIVSESLDEMQQHLTPAVRTAFANEGLTVYQGVTLASIVEQEVSKASDKPQVAQVFLKRLQTGMPLGSDVTAFYGSIINGQKASTTYDSPYNTLIHNGLPPGPISNVSNSSLQAVAHPANTDWLYFVAGDDGNTYFSHTLEEHQALTQQYCHKLCNQ